MRMYDIIEKKKNKLSLTKEEIEFFVNGYVDNLIPDYQVSSLLMAIVLNGMDDLEVTNLTLSMANSGDRLNLNFNAVDKHSTGGVGDKTTLIIISSMIEDLKNADKIYKLENKTLKEMNLEQEVYDD